MTFDYVWLPQALALILAAGVFAFQFWRTSRVLSLAIFWALFCGLRVFAWPLQIYLNNSAAPLFDAWSAISTALVFAMLGSSIYAQKTLRKYAPSILLTIFWVDVVLIIGKALFFHAVPFDRYGLLGNASMDACLIACLLPAMPQKNWIELVPPIAAILLTQSSMGIGVATVSMVVAFLASQGLSVLKAVAILAGISLIALVGYPHELFHTSGRLALWNLSFHGWSSVANPFTGLGLGTFSVWGPFFQTQAGFDPGGRFIWMHSDWLQVLFEQGWIGFSLWSYVFGQALRRSVGYPALVGMVAGYGAWALGNYPMHSALSSYVGILIGMVVFEKESHETLDSN